jgi:sarcosine oxidase
MSTTSLMDRATAVSPIAQPAMAEDPSRRADLIVVGAGAMGGWTAYWAQAGGGRRVTLLDAWGAGHPRATSGDETRITRAAHGDDGLYTRWARRALQHWRRFEEEWDVDLFARCGVLWFGHEADGFEARSARVLEAESIPHEWLTPDELVRRWPQVAEDPELHSCLYEPEGGALFARRACASVVRAFQREGGRFAIRGVRPGRDAGGRLLEVVDAGGRAWSGDQFVFACGPWLPKLFPDLLGDLVRITKQDVLFMGPPAGDRRFHTDSLPAWCDYDNAYYGIGATESNGVKIAPDRYGPVFDPSNGERAVDPESVRLARSYLRQRFPELADAPVVGTRVCQYETTPDAHFIIAPHPDYDNVWLVGGGSGHGFKHGPRIGEYLLGRLNGAPEGEQDGSDERRFRLGPRLPGESARTGGDSMAQSWELF